MKAVIALGANIGEPRENLDLAKLDKDQVLINIPDEKAFYILLFNKYINILNQRRDTI